MNPDPNAVVQPPQVAHPAPHRERTSIGLIGLSLAMAPAAWFTQLTVNNWLANQACFPKDVPLQLAAGAFIATVPIVDVVALVVAAAAGLLAWISWRRTAGEKPGSSHHLIESGDGRTRFMAMTGMLTSALFVLAIVLSILTYATMGGCGT